MPKKILLADDSITIQKVVELTFSDGDYEVTAVNNGAKALQKLAEMRPDIILSDIIMPEKNGYEVCEYVKSHPEFRNIPVVLLTGTFEPFDPDRAEKAGCDAVVTKPFESQSLIHKVEELIAAASQHSAAAAPAPPAAAEPEPSASPWMDDTPVITDAPEPTPSPFTTTSGGFAPVAPEAPSPFTTSGGSFPTPSEAFTHDADIFGAAPAPQATTEMPFDTPPADAFSSETRAFTKMSIAEMQQLASPPAPPALPDPSPWDEPAESSSETRAFTKMSFDDFQSTPPAPMPEPEAESPFGAPPQAFSAPEPEPQQAAEPVAEESPWDEPAASPFGGGETRAFPKMSFDELQQLSSPAPTPEPEPEAIADAPWASEPEPSAFSGGETRAFPKMSFDELQQLSSPAPAPEPEPAPWEEQPVSSWQPPEEPIALDTPSEGDAFSTTAVPFVQPDTFPQSSVPEDMPFASPTTDDDDEPIADSTPAEPLWSSAAAAEASADADEPPVPSTVLAPDTPSLPIARGELSDEQVDRIARRVVELMSDQVVRNIAWEVIPDLAEMVVKERIRQLEAEA
jgi:CheY-like chemotaxis protein